MNASPSRTWRALFVVGGVLYLAGGAQHPRGTMVEMLADPVWFRGHATIFVSLLVMMLGIIVLRRTRPAPASLDRWLLVAIIATVLEAVEMGVHTMAYVNADALVAGQSTPVLTHHLWLATLIYPVFSVALFGLIRVGQRERSLGSPWIGWIGMVGAVAHGVVMWLVFILGILDAAILFPIAALCISLWFILAGVWPIRRDTASGQ